MFSFTQKQFSSLTQMTRNKEPKRAVWRQETGERPSELLTQQPFNLNKVYGVEVRQPGNHTAVTKPLWKPE